MPFFLVGHLAGDERKEKPDGELIFAGTPIYDEGQVKNLTVS
jgi:hypothetical protein